MGCDGMGWVEIFQFFVGWVGSTIAEVPKIWKDHVNAFKERLDKIRLNQAVKFNFTAEELVFEWLYDTVVICILISKEHE